MAKDRTSFWSEDPPDSEGLWWLLGDEEFGSMGGNYTGTIPPDKKLRVVDVRTLGGNRLHGIQGGRLISLVPFDAEKRKPGFVGQWRKVLLPPLPEEDERAEDYLER